MKSGVMDGFLFIKTPSQGLTEEEVSKVLSFVTFVICRRKALFYFCEHETRLTN